MRKISADYIFPVSSAPIKNGIVVVDEDGTIASPPAPRPNGSSGRALLKEMGEVERYEGIIVPGFVNVHCHLELSHLKGQITKQKGLTGFISELLPKREGFSPEQVKAAIDAADEEMWKNGIVAVGDISNTDHSFEKKKKSKIAYHTFIEIFDLIAEKADEKLKAATTLNFKLGTLNSSIVPHAPYTVSGKLMELIDRLQPAVLSIHNQETASENELFVSGTGPLAELMQKAGVDVELKHKAGSSPLFTMSRLIEAGKILLVHNTYTSKQDLDTIKNCIAASGQEVLLCLCPRANLFIENRLPDIAMFMKEGMKLAIGTDSLASNDSLSMLDELKVIAKHFPEIPFQTLITWATQNGAEALGMGQTLGTIEKGKRPGLNLVKGVNLEKMKLEDRTVVEKLV